MTLTVLMGCPGSGKTTWARERTGGALVCSTDLLRTEARLRAQGATVTFLRRLEAKAERALDRGQDVTVDACNVHAHERARWLRLARQSGAETRLVVCHAPTRALLDVQRARGSEGVPEAKMVAYAQAFARALGSVKGEGWIEVVHIGDRGSIELKHKRVSAW